jgi:hypothetical protein
MGKKYDQGYYGKKAKTPGNHPDRGSAQAIINFTRYQARSRDIAEIGQRLTRAFYASTGSLLIGEIANSFVDTESSIVSLHLIPFHFALGIVIWIHLQPPM